MDINHLLHTGLWTISKGVVGILSLFPNRFLGCIVPVHQIILVTLTSDPSQETSLSLGKGSAPVAASSNRNHACYAWSYEDQLVVGAFKHRGHIMLNHVEGITHTVLVNKIPDGYDSKGW